MKIRVFEAFAGYGSQSLALERLKRRFPKFDYEVVGISEIDKYAVTAYKALHGDVPNYGDISKIDWKEVPDFDLFTMSSPCQDFSQAGLQKGGAEGSGTRSSLLWECRRAILAKKPKYIVFENVKALVSQKFLPYFLKWQNELASYGYTNFARVLNAKDFGVPQNRERIFMVSILNRQATYHFPEPFPLDRRIKDILEEDVDEKYFLSERFARSMLSMSKAGYPGGTGVRTEDDILAPTIKAGCYKTRRDDCFIKYSSDKPVCLNSKVDGKQPLREHRVYDSEGISTAITTGFMPSVLTPRRNEYGKSVRKEYENGQLNESRHKMTDLEPRTDGVSNTITTVQKDNLLLVNKKTKRYEQGNIFKNSDKGKPGQILSILRKEIGEEALSKQIGGLRRVFEEEVLQYFMYEKGIRTELENRPGGEVGASDSKESGVSKRATDKEVRTVWLGKECGCASQGWKLSEQFVRELNACLQKLPHEASSSEIYLRYLRKACKRPRVLQQALYTLEEIWQSIHSERGNDYRIRKLTPRECLRLQDVDDVDIDKMFGAGLSNTQLYKMAGNSIVVNVLYHIFRKMFVEKENENEQLTIF